MTPIDDEKSENPIDEYITFYDVMNSEYKIRRSAIASTLLISFTLIPFQHLDMFTQDRQYFELLMSKLSAEQTKALEGVKVIAEQKRAHYASQAIERQGGKLIHDGRRANSCF